MPTITCPGVVPTCGTVEVNPVASEEIIVSEESVEAGMPTITSPGVVPTCDDVDVNSAAPAGRVVVDVRVEAGIPIKSSAGKVPDCEKVDVKPVAFKSDKIVIEVNVEIVKLTESSAEIVDVKLVITADDVVVVRVDESTRLLVDKSEVELEKAVSVDDVIVKLVDSITLLVEISDCEDELVVSAVLVDSSKVELLGSSMTVVLVDVSEIRVVLSKPVVLVKRLEVEPEVMSSLEDDNVGVDDCVELLVIESGLELGLAISTVLLGVFDVEMVLDSSSGNDKVGAND